MLLFLWFLLDTHTHTHKCKQHTLTQMHNGQIAWQTLRQSPPGFSLSNRKIIRTADKLEQQGINTLIYNDVLSKWMQYQKCMADVYMRHETPPVSWNIEPLKLSIWVLWLKQLKKKKVREKKIGVWMLCCHIVFEYFGNFNRELGGGWSKRKKITLKGEFCRKYLFYYHKDHFYILFTLM